MTDERVGNELSVTSLLRAYSHGLFPMAQPPRLVRALGSGGGRGGRRWVERRGAIEWYCPDPRAVLPLDGEGGGFRVSRTLARTLRRVAEGRRFVLTTDAAFAGVIAACADPGEDVGGDARRESWIDDRIIGAYTALHAAGHAHSIEAWKADGAGAGGLVGGIYGVHIGGAFFAESMFCRPSLGGTDASKVCLAALVSHLRGRGFGLLDVQIANTHTRRFGVVEIGREAYLRRLSAAMALRCAWRGETASGLVGLTP